MRAKRVIPCLDVKDGRVVKGISFVDLRDAGDPVEMARLYDEAGADEVALLDITATTENRKTFVDVVERVSEVLRVPLVVGGGIRSLDDISAIINAGADKVCINSAAYYDPSLLSSASKVYGSQAIICAIDATRINEAQDNWKVCINGGKTITDTDAVFWAIEAEQRGAGEILLTSLDKDGTKEGFDLALTKAITQAVTIPVIASGGVGALDHFAQGILQAGADAVLAASVFHYGEISIKQVKEYLASLGITVLLDKE